MQLLFQTRDRDALGLRDWALQRLRAVLKRLSWRVSHASVQFTDVDGPRHGVDKRCQVSVVATDGTPVVVSATARDWRVALNLALARVIEALRRSFRRGQQARRAERQFVRQLRTSGAPES